MGQETVLVVENDQMLRELFAEMFKAENYHVATADLGEDAQTKLKQGGFDVVLLDVGIAKLNALKELETYKQYFSANASQKQPVVVAILMYEDKVQEAQEFADAVFVKSLFTPGQVLETVKSCLQKRQDFQPAAPV